MIMSLSLVKAIFINRAPFEHLVLDFKEKGINVLSAINGRGKTTVLSHIVDAFYEMSKPSYTYSFEGKENKYYRFSAPIFHLNPSKYSIVYFRFKDGEEMIDYLDCRGRDLTIENYESEIKLENRIPFEQIRNIILNDNCAKIFSENLNKKKVVSIFDNNVLTYFPSYRYEQPYYLNDPYKFSVKFNTEMVFNGYLPNPIEVTTEIHMLANWIMDVILDWFNYGKEKTESVIFQNLNHILSFTLSSKYKDKHLRFGIGRRNNSGQRISVMYDNQKDEPYQIVPNVFCLSAGELALLSMFGEILRQGDKIRKNVSLNQIEGIVLIDEVDMHLHIKLQKEILPKLIELFPNMQFIVSSHSPFLNMGLADTLVERSQIIDLDNNGITCSPTNNKLYKEVYDMMIGENQRYADKYNDLVSKIESNSKPIIITEGKTDYRHIRNAINKLGRKDIDVDFYEVPDDWGDSKLQSMLDNLSKIKQRKIVIGIFDRDSKTYLEYLDVEHLQYKTFGHSNVYAFAIPLVNKNIYGESISIEHYYQKTDFIAVRRKFPRIAIIN